MIAAHQWPIISRDNVGSHNRQTHSMVIGGTWSYSLLLKVPLLFVPTIVLTVNWNKYGEGVV